MTLRIEENELLAALLTAAKMTLQTDKMTVWSNPAVWRSEYQATLREFIELNKAEQPVSVIDMPLWKDGPTLKEVQVEWNRILSERMESRMRDGEK